MFFCLSDLEVFFRGNSFSLKDEVLCVRRMVIFGVLR